MRERALPDKRCKGRNEGNDTMGSRCFLCGCKLTAAVALLVVASVVFQSGAVAQATNLYSTGFERSEGFDPRLTLIGQGGWTGTDANGNGIVTNSFVNT